MRSELGKVKRHTKAKVDPIPPTIKQGDKVKLPSGEEDTIIDIQYAHDRYQTRNVSGWMYGIKDLEVIK
ncbi:hypothetical protein D3C73_1522070 [compost metagenome]